MLGLASGASAVPGVAGGSDAELRTFESFGAEGNAPDMSGRGTDDTAAIQKAIDWAYGDGRRSPRALLMGDRAYLCGNITLHPTTTIIGTGRHTSAFVCKTGTRGAWFGTRGGGAQKIMLSGMAFYGRHERLLSHVLELGIGPGEHPLGTESILEGLWMRDAPEGIGMEVSGNVAIINDITCQNTRIGLSARGNASHAQNVIVMQAGEGMGSSQPVIGAEIQGWFVRGLHIEATAERGVPLRLRGNTHILHAFISTATGYRHDHLIELDDSEYREWSLDGIRLSENSYEVSKGIIKHSSGYSGGRDPRAFTGRSLSSMGRSDLAGTGAPGSGAATEFVLTLRMGRDGLQHRIGSPGRPDTALSDPGYLAAGGGALVATPLAPGKFAGGGQLAGAGRNRFIFEVIAPAANEASGIAVIERNSTGVPLNVAIDLSAGALALVFTHGTTGDAVNLASLKSDAEVAVNVRVHV